LADQSDATLEILEDADEDEGEVLELLGEFADVEELPEPGKGKIAPVPALVPFKTSVFPALAVDLELDILDANDACRDLFTSFVSLEGKAFFEAFGKFFTMDDLRNIRETIRSGKNGYSWKGMARIKSRATVTVETRVYIFPAELTGKIPEQFIVMFDDVTEENRRLLRSVFMSLLEASKLKDNDTGQHIIRVNHYARRMAQELFDRSLYENIDADFIDNIGFLASMHDVGKIGTPDDILNKEGPLSDWEWTVMREHTKNGAFILSTYPNPMAKEIALSHHEKWNGTGYPFQLQGDMIPLAARIVSISDVYDALRMERSYKPAFTHNETLEKMMEGKGAQFDPTLLEVFEAISSDFDKLFESNKD
jgi:putative two-component system response regulator